MGCLGLRFISPSLPILRFVELRGSIGYSAPITDSYSARLETLSYPKFGQRDRCFTCVSSLYDSRPGLDDPPKLVPEDSIATTDLPPATIVSLRAGRSALSYSDETGSQDWCFTNVST